MVWRWKASPAKLTFNSPITVSRLVVDEVSMDYLRGAVVDFVEDVMGSGFKIENPNAVASCGCGSSFKTKDSGDTTPAASGGSCGC